MNLEQRLSELPPEWRQGVPTELLEASFHPDEAPAQSVVPQTRLRRIRLPYQRAKSSLPGDRAYMVESPEFFVRLGWSPIPVLNTFYYMRPPSDPVGPAEILVPVPEEEHLLALAYERAAAGRVWEGTAWCWPAKFTPAQVTRVSRPESGGLWDGRDKWRRRTGGTFVREPGWEDTSVLARFEVGHSPVWTSEIEWRPRPFLSEQAAGEESREREIASPPSRLE